MALGPHAGVGSAFPRDMLCIPGVRGLLPQQQAEVAGTVTRCEALSLVTCVLGPETAKARGLREVM